MAKEVSSYIQECLAEGISDYDSIKERAKNRIAEIDLELHRADGLRIEKVQLTNVLRELNDESVKRRRVIATVPNIELDDNSFSAKHLRYRICNLLSTDGAMTNRDIIQKVGGYQEEQRIIRAIKNLGETGVLARDAERKHVPGPNWEQRPTEEPVEHTGE